MVPAPGPSSPALRTPLILWPPSSLPLAPPPPAPPPAHSFLVDFFQLLAVDGYRVRNMPKAKGFQAL